MKLITSSGDGANPTNCFSSGRNHSIKLTLLQIHWAASKVKGTHQTKRPMRRWGPYFGCLKMKFNIWNQWMFIHNCCWSQSWKQKFQLSKEEVIFSPLLLEVTNTLFTYVTKFSLTSTLFYSSHLFEGEFAIHFRAPLFLRHLLPIFASLQPTDKFSHGRPVARQQPRVYD